VIAPGTPASLSEPRRAPQKSEIAAKVAVQIDLSAAVVERGTHPDRSLVRRQMLPASAPLELTLRLPIGSNAARYSVRLTSRHIAWSGVAEARVENGQPILRLHADLRHIQAGPYSLVVLSKGLHLSVPVLVKGISPNDP
jgi:hypothetical protein